MQSSPNFLSTQRNYLANSMHVLFSELMEESILSRTNLLNFDVKVFTERAWQLADNISALAGIVDRERRTSDGK
jgi:hypothetical protein